MNLFFGTLAVACLFPATTLSQGVLVLPQQAGDNNPVTSQSITSMAPPIAPVVEGSTSATSTPTPAVAGVVVLANSMANQPVSVAQTSTTLAVSVTPATTPSSPQNGLSSSATLSLSAGPSAATTLAVSVTPATTPSSTQDGLSSSATISLSAGPSASTTLMQSVTLATTASSTPNGLSSSGTTSLSTGPSVSTTLMQSVTLATTASSTPNGLSSSGTTSLSAGLSASTVPSPSTLMRVISVNTSIAFAGDLADNGVVSLPSLQSATILTSTSTYGQTTLSAATSVVNGNGLPVNGVISQSGSLAGTFVSSSVVTSSPPPPPPPPLPTQPQTASVNSDDSGITGTVTVQPSSGSLTAQIEDQLISQTSVAAASPSPSLVLAQNAAPAASTTAQEIACQNPGGVNGIDPSCWALLDMSNYTNTWWANNNAKCGGETANFSTCFWELHNLGTRDCTSVTPGACPEPDNSGLSAQDWYIAYNIYAVNQVFTSLYTAIGNANTLAAETVGSIVALIDPPAKENLLIDDLLTAVSATINIILPVGTLFQRHFIALTQQTPPVSKYLFPIGTTESQITQWSSIQQELAIVVENYQSNISQIIPTINNNEDIFVTFAESGAFSVNPLPNLANESEKLLLGLNTFIISKAFQANNLIIGQATDTDINQLVANSSGQLPYDTGCEGTGYNTEGLCGPFYYDPTIGDTFGLDNLGDMRTNYTKQLQIVLGNWTTGDMLFGGAYRCQNDGGIQGSLAQTVIATNGNITLDCLSDIRVCEWNLGSLDSDSEFTDCPTQAGYIVNGCKGCPDGSLSVNVPNAYLGAYLVNPSELDCVCNN